MSEVPSPTTLMTVCNFIAALLTIYNLLIIVRIMMGWFFRSEQQENQFYVFLKRITDPYLSFFGRLTALKRSRIDLTPIPALMVISILQSLLSTYGTHGKITLAFILAIIIDSIWTYIISFFFLIICALLVIRLIMDYRTTPTAQAASQSFDSILGGFYDWVQKTFFKKDIVPERSLIIGSLVVVVVAYFISSAVIRLFIFLIGKIPI